MEGSEITRLAPYLAEIAGTEPPITPSKIADDLLADMATDERPVALESLEDVVDAEIAALFRKHPSRPDNLSLRVPECFFPCDPIPDVHLGHEPHFFLAPFLHLRRVQDFSRGTVSGASLITLEFLPLLARNVLPGRGVLLAHIFELKFT